MRKPEAMTCLLCGREGDDVKVDLVEVKEPERMVDVALPATHRRDAVLMTVTVPERFYPVPRCRERAECKEREYGLAAVVEAIGVALPEAVPPASPVDDDDPSLYL